MNQAGLKDKIDQLIQESNRIIVAGHIGPDLDALCACVAVYLYLKKFYPQKEAAMMISGPTFSEWDFSPELKEINYVEDLGDHLKGADLLFLLDGNSLDRFSPHPGNRRFRAVKTVCLDHHLETERPTEFTLKLVDPSIGSACQIIADVLFAADSSLDQKIIEVLLAGILADTGNLHYVSYRNSSSLETIKRLVDLGKIEIQALQLRIDRFKLGEFELLQLLIAQTKNVKIKNLPGLTYSFLPRAVLKKYSPGLISLAYHRYLWLIVRQIEDHPWGFVVTPKLKNEFKISFRSVPGSPNVASLAEKYFEGGGHRYASGGRLIDKAGKTDSKLVAEKVLEVIRLNSEKIELTAD